MGDNGPGYHPEESKNPRYSPKNGVLNAVDENGMLLIIILVFL